MTIKEALSLAGATTALALSLTTLADVQTTVQAQSCAEMGQYFGESCRPHGMNFCLACAEQECRLQFYNEDPEADNECFYECVNESAWWCTT